MTNEQHYRQPWMSGDQWLCADMIARCLGGHHHMKEPKQHGKGVRVVMFQSALATYDFDILTRLVVHAHNEAIRVEVAAAGTYLAVNAWRRGRRDGMMHERHPTLEDAAKRILEQ